jgi:chromosome segregation ATPase
MSNDPIRILIRYPTQDNPSGYIEINEAAARQIFALIVPQDMHQICMELDKAKFMARLETLEATCKQSLQKLKEQADVLSHYQDRGRDDHHVSGQPDPATLAEGAAGLVQERDVQASATPADDAHDTAMKTVKAHFEISAMRDAEIAALRRELDSLHTMIAGMTHERDEACAELASLHTMVAGVTHERDQLKARVAELEAKLAVALGPDKDMEAFVSAIGKERDRLAAELTKYKEALSGSQDNALQWKLRSDVLATERDEARAELAALKGRKVQRPNMAHPVEFYTARVIEEQWIDAIRAAGAFYTIGKSQSPVAEVKAQYTRTWTGIYRCAEEMTALADKSRATETALRQQLAEAAALLKEVCNDLTWDDQEPMCRRVDAFLARVGEVK